MSAGRDGSRAQRGRGRDGKERRSVPSRAPCRFPHPACSVRARARRISALIRIRLMSSFRSSFCSSFLSAAASSKSSSASSTTLLLLSSSFASALAFASFSPPFPSVLSSFLVEGGASSLSSASMDLVASSIAAFQSKSLRWQAAMLDFKTAISYSR